MINSYAYVSKLELVILDDPFSQTSTASSREIGKKPWNTILPKFIGSSSDCAAASDDQGSRLDEKSNREQKYQDAINE